MRTTWLLPNLLLAFLAACSSSPPPLDSEPKAVVSEPSFTPSLDSMPEKILRATLVPHVTQIMVGEPAYVTHRLFNNGETPLQFREGGNQRNRLGRFDDYNLQIIREDGTALPAVDSSPNFGGMSWIPTVSDAESFSHELFLPNWVEFLEPGIYTIHSERTYATRPAADDSWPGDVGAKLQVSAQTQIKVIATDNKAMGDLIAKLGREMFSNGESDSRTQAWTKMGAIADPRVIPHYQKAIATRQYDLIFSGLIALSNFNDDTALKSIESAIKLRGPDLVGDFARPELAESSATNIRNGVANSLSTSPHPRAFALLLTMSTDSSDSVRLSVLHAIARKRPKDARKRITAFTKDTSEMVRNEAKRYLAEL